MSKYVVVTAIAMVVILVKSFRVGLLAKDLAQGKPSGLQSTGIRMAWRACRELHEHPGFP